MQLQTRINPFIIQELLESAPNAAAKGQAQYFTPTPWAKVLALPLPHHRRVVVDLTAGNGSLLKGIGSYSKWLACDIDPVVQSVSGYGVAADITKFHSLLREVQFEADLFALNPPWDLHWHRDRLKDLADSPVRAVATAFKAHDGRTGKDTIDSTITTLCLALDFMSPYGEGVLVANEATLQRLIFAAGAPHRALADHIWAHLVIEGNICQPKQDPASDFKTGVIWFARASQSGHPIQYDINSRCYPAGDMLAAATDVCKQLQHDRLKLRRGAEVAKEYNCTEDTVELWEAAVEEWTRITGARKVPLWNIMLDETGSVRTYLSLFDQRSATRIPKGETARLFALNGKTPMSLVIQKSHRKELQRAVSGEIWRVQPELQQAVAMAIKQYDAVRAPIRALNKIQRLGYLDEEDTILCEKPMDGFVAGREYAVRTQTISVRREGEKMNLCGLLDAVEWTGSELCIYIKDETGVERCFMEGRLRHDKVFLSLPDADPDDGEDNRINIDFTLQQLVDNFRIPEVPPVAVCHPELYQRYLELLGEIEKLVGHNFQFKGFQREDYAASAMHDGAILGHDTGGGKGLALLAWPCLKVGFEHTGNALKPMAPVLLVAPGDLHKQVMDEARDKFNARITVLDSQATFLRLSRVNPKTGRRELPAGFYITSYTQLGSNGVVPLPKLVDCLTAGRIDDFGSEQDIEAFHAQRAIYYKALYEEFADAGCGPDSTRQELHWAVNAVLGSERKSLLEAFGVLKHFAGPYRGLPVESKEFVRQEALRKRHAEFSEATGQTRWLKGIGKVKCVYSPTLADLCQDTFACVAVDEGVKMKGDETFVALGVRQMVPKHRLVLTATPIKNRLPDIFWLAWWAAGGHEEADARWPYPDEINARQEFAEEFLISERNVTKEEDTNRRYKKLTPQVCNVHRLWKLLAPIVLRRRKKDFGEDIVKKTRHVVRVPMGMRQASVYQYHLNGTYRDYKGRPAIGAQLQALRIAAANPASRLLEPRPSEANKGGQYYSGRDYIPKLHAALKLIEQVIARGEQVVVFSAFHDSLDALSARLNQAGVEHIVADGRMSQKKRGEAIKKFKMGGPRAVREGYSQKASQYPVLLAGVESVAEGHSMNLCNNVILMCYSWAYDKFEQAINRAHRLNSPWEVNVFPIICDGSIDRKLEALIQEKGDAAELVLDGHLLGEHSSEVNLAEILDIARKEFTKDNTVD